MHIDTLLIQIGVVLLLGNLLGRVLKRAGQPRVIAEIAAGIALGPSLLGAFWPEATATLFPTESLGLLGTVAQLGLVFFMFLVGLEFDPKLLQGRVRAAFAISLSGIVVPMALGVSLGFVLPAGLAGDGTETLSFALFLGVAMSVTAFPVLARILTERGIVQTPVGAMALAAAAVDDILAWCLLAVVVGIATAGEVSSALVTVAGAVVYSGAMWLLARPVLARMGPRHGGTEVSVELVTVAVLLVVTSATITEWIGIHALFGGFLVGAAMPREGGLSHALGTKLEEFVTIVMLPLFFAYSGLRTEIGLLHSWGDLGLTALLLVVATAGKFGGATLAARLTGHAGRESVVLGILMNTRGIMDLVVLNIGLDVGVISERMFAMQVVVALTSTLLTTPLLKRIYRPSVDPVGAAVPTPGADRRGLVLAISDPQIAPPLVALASAVARATQEPVWLVHLTSPERPHQYLKDQTGPQGVGALEGAERAARERGLAYEVISFATADPAEDLLRVVARKNARLLLLGTHRSTFGGESLRGVTGTLLHDCPSAVGILHHRGLHAVGTVQTDGAGTHGDAVAALAADLRGGGVVVDSAEGGVPDLKIRGFTPDAKLPAHPDTSLLLLRGAKGAG